MLAAEAADAVEKLFFVKRVLDRDIETLGENFSAGRLAEESRIEQAVEHRRRRGDDFREPRRGAEDRTQAAARDRDACAAQRAGEYCLEAP